MTKKTIILGGRLKQMRLFEQRVKKCVLSKTDNQEIINLCLDFLKNKDLKIINMIRFKLLELYAKTKDEKYTEMRWAVSPKNIQWTIEIAEELNLDVLH